MKIGGFHKNSFVDYPGKISAVVFTSGCNMNCFYCHNKTLCGSENVSNINKHDVLDYLLKRTKMLDGVVISGGEPTLQNDLEGFIFEIKEMGYKVKLDTNGTNPTIVQNLINKNLIDYIAMDIKAPLDKYNEVCGVDIAVESIEMSMDMIMKSGIDYEFRTTYIPQLTANDIHDIACRIQGSKKYILQQYRPNSNVNSNEKFDTGRKVLGRNTFELPHSDKYIYESSIKVKSLVNECYTRGLKVKVS